MAEESEKKSKYIPSLAQLRGIVGKLPDPTTTLDNTIKIAIDKSENELEFERIIIKKSDGTKSAKWSYKGRIFIDSKYIIKSENK